MRTPGVWGLLSEARQPLRRPDADGSDRTESRGCTTSDSRAGVRGGSADPSRQRRRVRTGVPGGVLCVREHDRDARGGQAHAHASELHVDTSTPWKRHDLPPLPSDRECRTDVRLTNSRLNCTLTLSCPAGHSVSPFSLHPRSSETLCPGMGRHCAQPPEGSGPQPRVVQHAHPPRVLSAGDACPSYTATGQYEGYR